jgi:hypothetical protein
MPRADFGRKGDPVYFDRSEFLGLADVPPRFLYRTGNHVTVLGPTESGKTWLSYQLLEVVARPSLPAIVMVMKPRDKTALDWSRKLEMRVVRSWPPVRRPFAAPPNGWTLWPRHTFDPDIDDPHLTNVFRAAMLDSYRRGGRILFADEIAGLVTELGLGRPAKAIWMRGRSMGCGLWAASQRPVDVPLLAYSSAEHLFLAHEPDKRGRDRFDEIGGQEDPGRVKNLVARLGKHEFLYLRRTGRRICVVGP